MEHQAKEENSMTTPALARNDRQGRTYAWPPSPPHEFQVLSVTTAINAGIAKPYLMGWAAKLVAETAVDDLDVITRMIEKGDEEGAISHLKGAPYRKRQAAADRGTLVHSALEAYLAGTRPTKEELKEQFREQRLNTKLWQPTLAMISGLTEFLYDEEPEIFHSEQTVFSRTHGYGGTADIIGRMRVGQSLAPVVIDIKTSKAVYDETAMQLAAYARADFVGLHDGTEAFLLPSLPSATIEHGVVVRPTPSGSYEKVVFALGDDVFEMFLAALTIARGLNKGVLQQSRRP
jgi:hypothetical protein